MAKLIDPGNKILRYPDVLAKMRAGEQVFPLSVEFDLSNRCTAKCGWCDFAYTHDGALMSSHLADRIFSQLAYAGVRSVTFTGGGDPSTHPDLPLLASLAKEAGLEVGLYTNGLLTKRIVQAAPSLTWAYISLDAYGSANYQQLKGVDGFDQASATIEALAKMEHGPTVGVGMLTHADSWKYAIMAINHSRQLGADYIQFRPVVYEQPDADYSWVPSALSVLDRLAGDDVYVSRQRFLDLYNKAPRGYLICRGSALVPCVGADGTLWVCPNTRGKRALGNLGEEEFLYIWGRREEQAVGPDCRVACRNHVLNQTLEYVCGSSPHDAFV